MRREINLYDNFELETKAPFKAWECLTIVTKKKQHVLIVKSESDMIALLTFLLVIIKSIDGERGSAIKFLQEYKKFIKK